MCERLVEESIERLAFLAGDVDAELLHSADCQRPHARCFSAGREHLEAVTAELAQQTFGHLAPGRVVRAQEEHATFRASRCCFSQPRQPLDAAVAEPLRRETTSRVASGGNASPTCARERALGGVANQAAQDAGSRLDGLFKDQRPRPSQVPAPDNRMVAADRHTAPDAHADRGLVYAGSLRAVQAVHQFTSARRMSVGNIDQRPRSTRECPLPEMDVGLLASDACSSRRPE
jgi:hypothetical protein